MSNYYKIEDICKVKGGKRIPQGEVLQTKKNEHPYIRILDMYQGRILNINDEMLYAKETYWEKISSYIVNTGDIVLAIVGNTLGMVSVIGDTLDKANLTENCCKFVDLDEKKVLPLFLYYSLKAPLNQKQIEVFKVGSSQPKLPIYNINQLLVPRYTIDKQHKIINILSDLDSKIENNNKISIELEAMARTIYDYWFLQFDFPDESGKPYKSSGGKMVWNEELKREIPEGWKVKRIKDCVKHINTGLNPRDNFVLGQGDIKYVTVKNLMSNGTLDFASCDTIDSRAKKIIHKRSDVAKGDILFASIAPLGRCFIVQEEPEKWDINESVFSIRPNIDMVSKEYLYLFFISQAFVRLAEFSSTGSVFYGIRISTLENMQIIIPDEDTMQKFTNYTSDILYKKYLNFIGNHELASLRDFLLPLLMNGQVGFKEC